MNLVPRLNMYMPTRFCLCPMLSKREFCPGKGGTVTINTPTLKDFTQEINEDIIYLKLW